MPPLPSIEIPVIMRSDVKGKAPVGRVPKPRMYKDEPLPVGPSDHAPKNAKIVGRVIEISGVFYQLKIGDVEINDVGVQEILDYVSPLELEGYEHRQFEEERIALEAAEAAEEAQKREKHERMKERARTKGVVFYKSDTETNDEVEVIEEMVGRHGRARPTYTHLFKKLKPLKGKGIVPNMDGYLSMSDDEDVQISESEPAAPLTTVRGPVSSAEPKRRRRKRDKVTGELLPLSPIAQRAVAETKNQLSTGAKAEKKKRQRRRRHPLTGELMPLGWRYNPNDGNDTSEKRRAGQSLLYRKSSISQEHKAKRPRLDTASEWSRSPSPLPSKSKSPLATNSPATSLRPFVKGSAIQPKTTAIDTLTSDDKVEQEQIASQKSPSRPGPSRSINNMMKAAALSSAAETSPEPVLRPFLRVSSPKKVKPTSSQIAKEPASPARPKQQRTSILNPSAGRASSTEPPVQPSEGEEESDDDMGDEWFIEAVLGHSWSDPRTHPESLGHKPVMLYQVKWEGYEDATWEPAESFTDRSVLNEYRRQVGLPHEPSDDDVESEKHEETITAPRVKAPKHPDNDTDDDDELLEEDEYEVEAIVGHHLSDPRTHPEEMGKNPVMLYHVKWKGYEELTWEPATSFEDTVLLQSYNEHFGIKESAGQ